MVFGTYISEKESLHQSHLKHHLCGTYASLKGNFCSVRWLACICELKSYADGSLVVDRGIKAGQILSDLSDKEGYPILPHWGVGADDPIPQKHS
jgi:hypothetical protein